MPEQLRILGLAGSLRRGSYNRATLQTAAKLVSTDVHIEVFDRLGEIPPFNQDDENNPPHAVSDLKSRIKAADAILFVTPEYNYSVPGVLKNAIDWASRPYGDNAWENKPVAVMGASTSLLGSARAQYHLRQSFIFLDMHPVNLPEVMIARATDKFDDQGNLTDETSRDLISELLRNLRDMTVRIERGVAATSH